MSGETESNMLATPGSCDKLNVQQISLHREEGDGGRATVQSSQGMLIFNKTAPRSALQSLKGWFPFSLAKHSLIKRGKVLIAPSVTSPAQRFIFPVVASVFY